jgi:hypothetical protein
MEQNIVIYQGSGGLVHCLGGLVYCIEWCKKYKHTLLIDIKNHEYFKHNFSDFFFIKNTTVSYSEDYSIIPKTITHFKGIPIEFIASNNASHFNNVSGYWINDGTRSFNIGISLDNYKRHEKIKMYCGTGANNHHNIIRYIGVKESIIKIIKDRDTMNLKNYIGVHFRNTDISNDIRRIISSVSKYKDNKMIYLATDDSTCYDSINNSIKNINLIQYTKPFNGNGKPIHITSPNKYEIIINILIDIYYLLHSDEFIESNESLVSRLVKLMRSEKRNIFY